MVFINNASDHESEFMHTKVVVKGKRTKRPRVHQPSIPVTEQTMTMAATTINTDPEESSTTTGSGSVVDGSTITFTDEEVYMANCLVLLSHGICQDLEAHRDPETTMEKFSSRRWSETATTTAGKDGLYVVYECKTCNKCFPSFQALGGHRASHKKPKTAIETTTTVDEKKHQQHIDLDDDNLLQISMYSFSKYSKSKVHECSICGAEFGSGQALGGHMRRHRPAVIAAGDRRAGQEVIIHKEQRNMLSLDLNLPAPSSDEDKFRRMPEIGFEFSTRSPAVMITAVDCHY